MVAGFHETNGTMGTRMMRDHCKLNGFLYSVATIRKYMKELNLSSCIRRKKKYHRHQKGHHIYPNLFQQQFSVEQPNAVWCMDFTYLYLKNGTVVYNCSVIDLFNREIVASVSGYKINTTLAMQTMSEAFSKKVVKPGLILHTDQGSQFTSHSFDQYCKDRKIQQSMSKAGCPYDNAVMERYFNSLKNECTNHYQFETKDALDKIINKYSFDWYNTRRPHTFNGGLPPLLVVQL